MKIRAIGTGSFFCRHPLVTSSFLIQSESSNVIIGCGPNIPAKLETINLGIEQIDMWVPLSHMSNQVAGLEEVAEFFSSHKELKKPYLVAPSEVLSQSEKRFTESGTLTILKDYFEVRASTKITINEEHMTETLSFVKTHTKASPSYGITLEESEILITGDMEVNEEFLHRYGMPSEIIMHSCYAHEFSPTFTNLDNMESLLSLPMYLQKKIWLYGYENSYQEEADPIPMLYLPQGTCVYDSDRKEKHLDKERFLRENAKRQIGNINSDPQAS